MISADDFALFCGRTIDGMARALDGLSDREVNRSPDVEGANSAYALVTHALAAAEWWTEYVVLGHPIERDRPSEFTATGAASDLIHRCDAAKARIAELAPQLGAAEELHGEAVTQIPLGADWTVGAALIHAYEELAQHLGHLEITVDLVRGAE